jgi:hypothetical protein
MAWLYANKELCRMTWILKYKNIFFAVQGFADVRLPTGQNRSLSCFFLTVAASGMRKTSVDNEALRRIRRYESDLRVKYALDELPSHRNTMAAWEEARKAASERHGKDSAAIKAALDKIGEQPKASGPPEVTMDDMTIEGLTRMLAGRPGLGIFTSEGAQFMQGHGMADDVKRRTAGGLCTLWDGGDIRRVRSDGIMFLPARRLSMHLMAQPGSATGSQTGWHTRN